MPAVTGKGLSLHLLSQKHFFPKCPWEECSGSTAGAQSLGKELRDTDKKHQTSQVLVMSTNKSKGS